MAKNQERIAIRLPIPLRKAMKSYVEADTHMNESDFVRAAIREKLEDVGREFLKEEIQKRKENR